MFLLQPKLLGHLPRLIVLRLIDLVCVHKVLDDVVRTVDILRDIKAVLFQKPDRV